MTTTISATLYLSNCGSEFEVTGEGSTREEAIEACLKQARGHIELSTKVDSTRVSLELAERLPKPPEGMRLLVMYRHSHNSGDVTSERIFAVTQEPFHMYCNGRPCYNNHAGNGVYEAGDMLIRYSSVDSNSESTYTLPRGSQEYVDGKWVPRRRVRYYY